MINMYIIMYTTSSNFSFFYIFWKRSTELNKNLKNNV